MIVRPATIILAASLVCACPPPKPLPPDASTDRAISDGPAHEQPARDASRRDASDASRPADHLLDRPRSERHADLRAPDLPLPDHQPAQLDGQGGCAASKCLIGGTCLAAGTKDSNPCRVCDPLFNRYLWAPAPGCTITLAGSGAPGFADGPAYTAALYAPNDLAVDQAGTVYIADTGAHLIRAVSGGQLITVAGKKPPSGAQPIAGYAEGAATSAQFEAPLDVAVDGSGTVYVADSANDAIRAIASGVVSTHAGGQTGSKDGLAPIAEFFGPHGIARTPAGTLYVAEMGNCLVREIAGGKVSTVAGMKPPTCGLLDGSATSAKLDTPYDLVVDGAGDIYIADHGNHLIRKLSKGQLSTVAGTVIGGVPQQGHVDGPATTAAKLDGPVSVALDPSGGKLYFTDNTTCLRVLDAGSVSTINVNCSYGDADGAMLNKAQFQSLRGVTTDAAGRVYLVDRDNRKVKVYQPPPP